MTNTTDIHGIECHGGTRFLVIRPRFRHSQGNILHRHRESIDERSLRTARVCSLVVGQVLSNTVSAVGLQHRADLTSTLDSDRNPAMRQPLRTIPTLVLAVLFLIGLESV